MGILHVFVDTCANPKNCSRIGDGRRRLRAGVSARRRRAQRCPGSAAAFSEKAFRARRENNCRAPQLFFHTPREPAALLIRAGGPRRCRQQISLNRKDQRKTRRASGHTPGSPELPISRWLSVRMPGTEAEAALSMPPKLEECFGESNPARQIKPSAKGVRRAGAPAQPKMGRAP